MVTRILQAFKNFSWKQWAVLALFLLVVGFTGFYAVHTVERARYWRSHHDQPLANWMSINYIAHSYRIPPPVLYEAVKLEPIQRDRRPLVQIAKLQKRSVEEVKKDLEDAIEKFRTENPPPETGGNS